jgi:hypothetical protein
MSSPERSVDDLFDLLADSIRTTREAIADVQTRASKEEVLRLSDEVGKLTATLSDPEKGLSLRVLLLERDQAPPTLREDILKDVDDRITRAVEDAQKISVKDLWKFLVGLAAGLVAWWMAQGAA